MDESMRVRILGDAKGAKDAFEQVSAAADATARRIEGTFHHAGSILKKAIGITAVSVGLEMALEGASKLINLQKVQSKLLDNANVSKKYELQGTQESVRWYSKILDQQATQLSLSNGIAKGQVVQAQTLLLQNSSIRKLYDDNKGAMTQALDAAANLSEVMGGGGGGSIVSSAKRLNMMMTDPAKKMNAMARQGVTFSKAEQDYVKAQQASAAGQKGIQLGQIALLKVIKKEYGGVAAAAASPVELLKNLYQNVMLSLGTGLIPILDTLAQALIPPVQALLPVLEFMANTIGAVSVTLGKALGSILSALVPLFTLMTNSIIPALLNIITPLIQMVDAALTPIVKVFSQMVGTAEHLGPLAKVIADIGVQTAKNLQPAIKAVADTFNQMASSGALQELFQAILDSMVALAPIIPQLATNFSNMLIALLPIVADSGPEFAKIIKLWTQLLQVVVPLILSASGAITEMMSQLGGLSKPIAVLLAVWFTRGLFLLPIRLVVGAIGGLIGKMKTLKEIMAMTRLSTGGGFITRLAGVLSARSKLPVTPPTVPVPTRGGFAGKISDVYLKTRDALKKTIEVTKNFASKFVSMMKTAFTGVSNLARAFGSKFTSIMGPVFSKVRTAASVFYTKFMMVAGVGFARVRILAQDFGSKFTSTMSSTFSRVGGASRIFAAKLVAQMKIAFSKAGTLAQEFGSKFSSMMSAAFTKGGNLARLFASKMVLAFQVVGAAAKRLIFETLIPAMSTLFAYVMANPIVLAIAAIVIAVAALIYLMVKHWKGFMTGVMAVWHAIVAAAKWAFNLIKAHWRIFISLLLGPLGIAIALITKYWHQIAAVFKFVWNLVVAYFKFGIKVIKAEITILKNIFVAIWHGIYAVFKFVWNLVVAYFKFGIKVIKAEITFIKNLFVAIWHGIYGAFKWVWDKITAGFHWLVGLFQGIWHTITNLGKSIWNGMVNGLIDAVNMMIGIWNSATGWIPWLGSAVHVGTIKHIGETPKAPIKKHSGGIVPGPRGKEVPAILQAGEAVVSLAQMNRTGMSANAGASLNVHPGAVNITINGNADAQTVALIKQHVNAQFDELHRTLKSMGR
jgi:hypothetical protein